MCNFIIKSDSVYEIKGKRGKGAYLVWALATEGLGHACALSVQ